MPVNRFRLLAMACAAFAVAFSWAHVAQAQGALGLSQRGTPAPQQPRGRTAPSTPAPAQQRGTSAPAAPSLAATVLRGTPVAGISGVYTGFYICSQGYTPLKLSIVLDSSGSLSGLFAFEPPGGRGATKETAYSMKGQYTPQTGQFRLTGDRWVTSAPIGYQMIPVAGTYDARTDTLQAKIAAPGCNTVDVKRDAALSDRLMAELSGVQTQELPGTPKQEPSGAPKQTNNLPPGVIASGQPAEVCLAFKKWAGRMTEEYPGVDFNRTVVDTLYPKFANLFEDEYFIQFFGKTFDQLAPAERTQIGTRSIRQCFTNPQYSAGITFERLLDRPFILAAGDFSTAQVLGEVILRRRLRQELTQVLTQAKNSPAQAGAWEQTLAMESQAKRFEILWPSETKGLGGAITDAKRRAATPALEARVKAAVATASGFEGLKQLEQFPTQQAALFSAADPNAASASRQQLGAKSNAILAELLATERTAMQQIPTGLAGLQRGAAWYQSFQNRFGTRGEPEVREVTRAFLEKRNQTLVALQPELSRMIQQANTSAEVDGVFRTYLPLPSDSQSPLVATMMKSAEAKKDALDRTAILGKNAPPPTGAPGTGTSRAPAGDPSKREPTEAEMYDAVKARLDRGNAFFKDVSDACKSGNVRGDVLLALACLGTPGAINGRPVQYKVTSFRKTRCQPAKGKTGWVCDYSVGFAASGPDVPASIQVPLGAGDNPTTRFVWDGREWIALSLDE